MVHMHRTQELPKSSADEYVLVPTVRPSVNHDVVGLISQTQKIIIIIIIVTNQFDGTRLG